MEVTETEPPQIKLAINRNSQRVIDNPPIPDPRQGATFGGITIDIGLPESWEGTGNCGLLRRDNDSD